MKLHWGETFQAPKIVRYFLHENDGKIEKYILDISKTISGQVQNLFERVQYLDL